MSKQEREVQTASNLELLDWDSSLFGYKVAQFNTEPENLYSVESVVTEAQEKKVRLLYVFANREEQTNQTILDLGGSLVDEKVTFVKKVNNKPDVGEQSEEVVSALGDQFSEEWALLAYQSGVYSRFKIDSNFRSGEFEKLYRIWMEKSLSGEIAFDVLAIKKNNKPVGLLTLGDKSERIDIGLVAVDEDSRREGIGSKLMNKAILIADERGVGELQVVTQLGNSDACKYYKSFGFEEESVDNVYHFWL